MPARKKAAPKTQPKKAAKTDDNVVSLKALAEELGISPAAARRKLRSAEIERDGRWAWKDGSRDLTKVRKVLEAEAA